MIQTWSQINSDEKDGQINTSDDKRVLTLQRDENKVSPSLPPFLSHKDKSSHWLSFGSHSFGLSSDQ